MDMKKQKNSLTEEDWYNDIWWEKDKTSFKVPFYHKISTLDWYTPRYIDLKPRKELIHGDFGKRKTPYIKINGSVIGNCLNNPKEIWKDNMTNIEFLKLVLKVDLKMKPINYDYLIPILEELDRYGKRYC